MMEYGLRDTNLSQKCLLGLFCVSSRQDFIQRLQTDDNYLK